MRTLTTARLTLEPQTTAHADAMYAVLCDPALYAYENEPPVSREWLRTRFEKLETRASASGDEQWLNWVIRLPSSDLIGYVQATVAAGGTAYVAYVLSSAHWGRGLAREAVEAMIGELVDCYGVGRLLAVLKRENARSLRLLQRLGFSAAGVGAHAGQQVEPDEVLMYRDEAMTPGARSDGPG